MLDVCIYMGLTSCPRCLAPGTKKIHSNYTCLDSTAAEYSLPKVRSVIDTSSRII